MKLKITSGGQTGADRAALDFAIDHTVEHGGWCPKGRKALDGTLDEKYLLRETPSSGYLQRTEWNVRDTEGTVVFTLGKKLTGGSLRTYQFAEKYHLPVIHISLLDGSDTVLEQAVRTLAQFCTEHELETLNVAGSRENKEPGIYRAVYNTLKILTQQFAK